LPQRLFRAAAWIAIGASIAPAIAEPAKRSSNSRGFDFGTNQRAASRHGSGTVLARFRVEPAASRSSPSRKLLIAIWRFVTLDLALEGAIIAA
jgi:hypothetical protein